MKSAFAVLVVALGCAYMAGARFTRGQESDVGPGVMDVIIALSMGALALKYARDSSS